MAAQWLPHALVTTSKSISTTHYLVHIHIVTIISSFTVVS